MTKNTFEIEIAQIGQNMTTCESTSCKRIINNPNSGILPRCLFFEKRSKQDDIKHITIAVGMNPGMAGPDEMEKLKGIASYMEVCNLLGGYKTHDYYKRSRWLIGDLGLSGDILWTEVVKCQNEVKRKNPDVYTSAYCAGRYLYKEVIVAKECYDSITIIAIGKEVYDKMIFMFPKEKIIGIYHPRSHGYFDRMFDTSKKEKWVLRNQWEKEIKDHINSKDENHAIFKG